MIDLGFWKALGGWPFAFIGIALFFIFYYFYIRHEDKQWEKSCQNDPPQKDTISQDDLLIKKRPDNEAKIVLQCRGCGKEYAISQKCTECGGNLVIQSKSTVSR